MKNFYQFIYFSIVLSTLSFTAFSQSNINMDEDPRLEAVVSFHKECNQKIQKTEGFRVQIYANSGQNSLNSSKAIKEKFAETFPNVPAYISFYEPNFRVRVGDFRTRMEARCFLNEIKSYYSDSFVVKDEINYPDL